MLRVVLKPTAFIEKKNPVFFRYYIVILQSTSSLDNKMMAEELI